METTQTEPSRSQHGNPGDHDIVLRAADGAALTLSYLTPAEFAVHQVTHKGRILGAIAFGTQRQPSAAPDCPYAWVDMPVLNGESAVEVWSSALPVVREDGDELASARNDDVLFGCLQMRLQDGLDTATRAAYSRIFDFIDSRGYPHLLRVWNYFPQINADAEGLERYARFNVGRHDAFAAKGRIMGTDTPAACALGSRGAHLVIYFLAAKQQGQRVENPRQVSAFLYPPQYGPRSPIFARATLMRTGGTPLLFISGTASIVGHETLHIGDAPAQARETVANLVAVMAQAQMPTLGSSKSDSVLMLKAYLRHPHHLPIVREGLLQAFGPAAKVLYLQADICRSNLLLEVEAVYQGATASGY